MLNGVSATTWGFAEWVVGGGGGVSLYTVPTDVNEFITDVKI